MTYKTYSEQIGEHIEHLQGQGIDIDELLVDWHGTGKRQRTGDGHRYAYITTPKNLNNGLLGLQTLYLGPNGSGSFKTYGLGPDELPKIQTLPTIDRETMHEQASARAKKFWDHCSLTGSSGYLESKGVIGHYGIRYRPSEKFGSVAVVPMLDWAGRIWGYQLLNPDGRKLYAKNSRTEGLFYPLGKLVNGSIIGVSEGFASAATVADLIGIAMVCAFSCDNMPRVTKTLIGHLPDSLIILFCDSDRHLVERGLPNAGLEKALEAQRLCPEKINIIEPYFGDLEKDKNHTDFNDMLRLYGADYVKDCLKSKIQAITTL